MFNVYCLRQCIAPRLLPLAVFMSDCWLKINFLGLCLLCVMAWNGHNLGCERKQAYGCLGACS